MKKFIETCITLILFISVQHQAISQNPILLKDTVVSYQENNLETTGEYGFAVPVRADVLNNVGAYSPSATNRYFMSLFGPRYKAVPSSNVLTYDFHQGEDFTPDVKVGNTQFGVNNPPAIHCMCAGTVYSITDTTDAVLEQTENGRSVTIKCDSTFHQSNWGNIYINYRHMSVLHSDIKNLGVGGRVYKNDTIGTMGSSGFTSTLHLHLSISRKSDNKLVNVHTMRVFNPLNFSHLHKNMDTLAQVSLLKRWDGTDSALFRVAVPFNQMVIKSVKFKYTKLGLNEKVFDFEEVSNNPNRDNNSIVPGLTFYAYPFNRYQSVYSRLISNNNEILNAMHAAYPASNNRPQSWGRFPVPNAFPYNAKAYYVFDLMVKQISTAATSANIYLDLFDIYGNRLQTTYTNFGNESELILLKSNNQNQENLEETAQMFPNPAKDYLSLHNLQVGQSTAAVKIFNSEGKEVFFQDGINQSAELNISSLSAGMYFLKVLQQGEEIFSRTLIVMP